MNFFKKLYLYNLFENKISRLREHIIECVHFNKQIVANVARDMQRGEGSAFTELMLVVSLFKC